MLNASLDIIVRDNDRLRKQIADLEEKLSRYEHPKNSHNSHLPPSKDPLNKKRINLRKPSSRRTGGQKGHPGKTLEFGVPDKIENLYPHYCTRCGESLSSKAGELVETRQQIDLPLIQSITTEYCKFRKICSCKQVCEGEFPTHVSPGIGYGPGVDSLVSYLSVCQYLPYERLTDVMRDVFGIPLSEGTVDNILKRMETRSHPAYEVIREKLSRTEVIGADETTTSIKGKKCWSWVFQNPKYTYIIAGQSRKKDVFTKVMPGGMPETVLVSDCLSGYFSQNVKHHQICTSHILRELIGLSEQYENQQWSSKMAELIREVIHLKKTIPNPAEHLSFIKKRFQMLLEQLIDKSCKKVILLQKRLQKYKDYLFYFLENEKVPPDNNASERAIRCFKIKTKVSGYFNSKEGAQCFAQLHSITDTARKNNQSPVKVLREAAMCRTNVILN